MTLGALALWQEWVVNLCKIEYFGLVVRGHLLENGRGANARSGGKREKLGDLGIRECDRCMNLALVMIFPHMFTRIGIDIVLDY